MPYGQRSRAELLAEIRALPDFAPVTSQHAAAFLDTSTGVLANWRSQRRGPRFEKNGDFVRYRISALKAFLAGDDALDAPPKSNGMAQSDHLAGTGCEERAS